MKHVALIVAAGLGSRYSHEIPKQFTKINDKMIIEYTIEKFLDQVDIIMIVVSQEYFSFITDHFSQSPHIYVCLGGESRQHSVYYGLKQLQMFNPDIVAIHDGVRLLVSKKMIADSLEIALQHHSAIPIIPVIDSLWQQEKENTLSKRCIRDLYVCSQTPQSFKYQKILVAHQQAESKLSTFSDCAGVYIDSFNSVYTYKGDKNNIKLTTTEDTAFIEFMLS